jgi:hypothetical protein
VCRIDGSESKDCPQFGKSSIVDLEEPAGDRQRDRSGAFKRNRNIHAIIRAAANKFNCNEEYAVRNRNPTVSVGHNINTLEYKDDQHLSEPVKSFICGGEQSVSLLIRIQGIFDTEEDLIDSLIRLLSYQKKSELPKYRHFRVGRPNSPAMCSPAVLYSGGKIYIVDNLNNGLESMKYDFTTALYNYVWVLLKRKRVEQVKYYNFNKIYQLCFQGMKAPFHDHAIENSVRVQVQELEKLTQPIRDDMYGQSRLRKEPINFVLNRIKGLNRLGPHKETYLLQSRTNAFCFFFWKKKNTTNISVSSNPASC